MKYSDITATIALVIALGGAFINYHENELTRLEANKPKIVVNVELNQKDSFVRGSSVLLSVNLDVQNTSQNNARNVRGVLSLYKTNSFGYAHDTYSKDLTCSVPIDELEDTLYPGKSAGANFILSDNATQNYVNPNKEYLFRNIYEENSDSKYALLGCVSYSMDGSDVKFTEEVMYEVGVICSDGSECNIFGAYTKHGVPRTIVLRNNMF